VETDLSRTDLGWVVLGLGLMAVAMVLRAVSWHASLKAALPRAGLRLVDAMRGLFIGVLVSSTLPANLGEPSRALVVARRTGRPRENLSTVAGTLVSQSLLNVVAVTALTIITLASVDFGNGAWAGLATVGGAAIGVTVLVLGVPTLLRRARPGSWLYRAHTVAERVRSGLTVFRQPRLALAAVGAQMSAWALQWLAVYVLLVAAHLQHPAGLIGAAAVLCAVNVTMLLPVTPGDVGVFQAAVAAVLNTGWHIPYGAGVAYGVVLQAAELVTALAMGAPALVAESRQGRHQRLWRP
jgi:phosphatidylinositol alpha-mannosyltransferase